MGRHIYVTTVENSTKIPQKIRNEIPYDPVILLLGIYLEKTKTLVRKDICTPMVIAALFIIAKIWKQHSVHRKMSG